MHHSDSGCWAARGRAEQGRRTGRASSQGGDSGARAKRGGIGAALRASVLVVLEAAVPTYAFFGWDGLGDGPGGTKVSPTQRRSGDVEGGSSGAGSEIHRSPSASTGCSTPLVVVNTADE